MKFKIYPVDAKRIIEVAELYWKYKESNKDLNKEKKYVAQALGVSEVTLQNAIGAMKQLKLDEVAEQIAVSTPEGQRRIFRKALQSYKPFLDFLFFLNKGDKPEKAIRKVLTVYDIKRKAEDVLWAFKNWGCFAGIFKDGTFELLEDIKPLEPPLVEKLREALNDEIKARLWVRNVLGESENFLSQDEYESLIKAILKVTEDPRESVKLAGEVLEDVLRKVAKDRGVDVCKKNGITQIAEELRKGRVLAGKHVPMLRGIEVFLDRDIFDGLAAFRNMAHHSKDKEELKRWEMSEELALAYAIIVLLCIKSVIYYVVRKKLVF